MNLDQPTKDALQALSDAINSSLERSSDVRLAIDRVRALGIQPVLPLKLEILVETTPDDAENPSDFDLDLTDDDVRTLRRMKIRL